MRTRIPAIALILALSLLLVACGSKPPASESSASGAAPGTTTTQGENKPGLMDRLTSKPVTIPEGTIVTVRLNNAVGSKISNSGDAFTATVAEPVMVGEKEVIPKGAEAAGVVTEAVPLGRFKGGAKLRLVLDTVKVGGNTYKVETAAITESAKGKGKRTAVAVGGGAGLGAIVGGLVGGGKGAAIGAAAGAGAGTAGAAFTGNKNIELPAETAVSFKLLQPLEMK